jgi:hypothetical protein
MDLCLFPYTGNNQQLGCRKKSLFTNSTQMSRKENICNKFVVYRIEDYSVYQGETVVLLVSVKIVVYSRMATDVVSLTLKHSMLLHLRNGSYLNCWYLKRDDSVL